MIKDKTGLKVGKLTVIERAPDKIGKDGQKRKMWKCRCDCGNETIVRDDSLNGIHTLSCGCYQKDRVRESASESAKNRTKYKPEELRIRNIWNLMKYRCENPEAPAYDNYGGRGIKICEEWSDNEVGYENFKAWAFKNGYDEALTIDRLNNDEDYSPHNCRWTDTINQNNNKRNNVRFAYCGETHTMSEWARIKNIPMKTLHRRIHTLNWDIERALTTPVRTK